MGRLLALTLLAAVLLRPPGSALAAAPPLEVSGAIYAEFDARHGIWLLRGSPVILTRGATRLEAAEVRYAERSGVAVATGGVVLRHETITVRAGRIEARLAVQVLVAEGQVAAAASRPDGEVQITAGRVEAYLAERRLVATVGPRMTHREATLTATRLEYQEAAQSLTASGGGELLLPEGRLSADRIRAHFGEERVEAQPDVRIVAGDLSAEAPAATFDRRAGVARLSGGALVRRGSDSLTAATITVDLRARRAVATGTPRLVLGAK